MFKKIRNKLIKRWIDKGYIPNLTYNKSQDEWTVGRSTENTYIEGWMLKTEDSYIFQGADQRHLIFRNRRGAKNCSKFNFSGATQVRKVRIYV